MIKSTKFVPAYDEGARERRRTKKPIAIRILEEINKIKSEVIILGGVRVLEVIVDRWKELGDGEEINWETGCD